jgi:OHCU decarboxylase
MAGLRSSFISTDARRAMLKLAELNAASGAEFTELVGPVFEHSPWIAARGAEARPFETREELHRALCGIVSAASEEEKLALIRAHPDLVGRAVLTRESQDEQTRAGLLDLSEEEVRMFQRYNEEYRERFGFPFVDLRALKQEGGDPPRFSRTPGTPA